jgi:membrane protein
MASLRGGGMSMLKKKWFQTAKQIVVETVAKTSRDDLPRLASSLSFFSILSLSPFLLLLVGVIDLFVGHGEGAHRMLEEIGSSAGTTTRDYVATIVHSGQSRIQGYSAGLLSLTVTFFAASNLFIQVDGAMATIWNTGNGSHFFKNLVVSRLIAFLSVLVFGAILLGWVGLDSALAWTANHGGRFPGWTAFSTLLTAVFLSAGFSFANKVVSRGRLTYRQALPGGIVTGVGFAISKLLLAFYFSRVSTVNGAAGGAIILLLWVYYSCLIFLFGGELNCVLASRNKQPDS